MTANEAHIGRICLIPQWAWDKAAEEIFPSAFEHEADYDRAVETRAELLAVEAAFQTRTP